MKDKISRGIRFMLERAREPSTWTAAATLAAIAHFDPTFITQLGSAAPVVAGLLLGVFLPEKGKTEE